MRIFPSPQTLSFSLCFGLGVFTTSLLAQDVRKPVAGGHSFSAEQACVEVTVRCFHIPVDALREFEEHRQSEFAPNVIDAGLRPLPAGNAQLPGIRLISSRRVVQEERPLFTRVIADSQLREFIRTAQSHPSSNLFLAPVLVIPDGETGEVTVSEDRGVAVHDPAGGGLSPGLKNNETGSRLVVRADIRDDEVVRIHLCLSESETAPSDRSRSVADSVTTSTRTEFAVDLQPGSSAAVWGSVVEAPALKRGSLLRFAAAGRNAVDSRMMLLIVTPDVKSSVDPKKLQRQVFRSRGCAQD